MRRIRKQLEDGCVNDTPYSRFLIRQGMELSRDFLATHGVKPDTFSKIQEEGAARYGELCDCIRWGQKGRALSIAFHLQELLSHAVYVADFARRSEHENQPTNS